MATATRKQNTPAAPVEENPYLDVLADVEDGSNVVQGRIADLAETVKSLPGLVKAALKQHRAGIAAARTLAEARMSAAVSIVKDNGHPDWNASTAAYRSIVAAAESTIWETAESGEKQRIEQSMRQLKGRGGILEDAITRYVVERLPEGFDSKTLKWAERADGLELLTGRIPDEVRNAIRAEYASTARPDGTGAIAPPAKFLTEAEIKASSGNAGGPGKGDPKDLNASMSQYVGATEAGKVTAENVARDILRLGSALFTDRVQQAPKVKLGTPETVQKLTLRASVVLRGYGALLAEKLSDEERRMVEAALWADTDRAA